jgi:hypothetical protein
MKLITKAWISSLWLCVAVSAMALVAPGCDDADQNHHDGNMHGEHDHAMHDHAMHDHNMHDGSGDTVRVVNARCPIMGNRIDPNGVPENLTVEWQGKTIGFCCAACPPRWEDLSDEEKQQKLAQATADSQE